MKKDFVSIDVRSSAFEASKIIDEEKMGYVIERGRPVRIMTEKDLVLKVMAADKNLKDVEISQIMSSPLVTIDPDDDIEKAVEIMKKHDAR